MLTRYTPQSGRQVTPYAPRTPLFPSYGGGSIPPPYGPYSQAAYAAANVISHGLSNLMDRRHERIQREGGRRAKRARSGRRAPVAEPPSRSSSTVFRHYQFGTSNTFESLTRKTLYASIIKPCLPPSNNDDLTAAPAMSYYLSGFRYCLTVQALGNTLSQHVHVAIVQPKEFNLATADTALLGKDMFVNNTDSSERYADFNERAANTAWGRTQDCSPLNSRKFNILMHKKIIVNQTLSTSTGFPNIKHFEEWVPVKRRFEYEKIDSNDVIKPLIVMIWHETLTPDAAATLITVNMNTRAFVRKAP